MRRGGALLNCFRTTKPSNLSFCLDYALKRRSSDLEVQEESGVFYPHVGPYV